MSNETAYTRSDLIESIYKGAQATKGEQLTRNDSIVIFDSFLEKIVSLLQENGEVRIPKFGIFSVKEKSARMGRNPKTGNPVEIPAHNAINFKPSSILKSNVETSNINAQKAA